MIRLLSFLALAAGGVSAACVGPEVNQATIDLIKEFESFQPDICGYYSLPDLSFGLLTR